VPSITRICKDKSQDFARDFAGFGRRFAGVERVDEQRTIVKGVSYGSQKGGNPLSIITILIIIILVLVVLYLLRRVL
jgi:hypothetical protein